MRLIKFLSPIFFWVASCFSAPAIGLHYGGDGSNTQYNNFEKWLGVDVLYRVSFIDRQKWSDISNYWYVGTTTNWVNSRPGRIEVISLPMMPIGVSFNEILSGNADIYYLSFAQKIKDKNIQNRVIIRLGWEGNGSWYPWSYVKNTDDYIQSFRRIVSIIRSVINVKFEWNISNGANGIDWKLGYPGHDVVDIISMDVYDHYIKWNDILNGPSGLIKFREFCVQAGKPEAYPEWGVVTNSNGNGDNPSFIENMYNWFKGGNVLYQGYWNSNSETGSAVFGTISAPMSSEKFLFLFGKITSPTNLILDPK